MTNEEVMCHKYLFWYDCTFKLLSATKLFERLISSLGLSALRSFQELLGNLRAAEVEADRGHRYRRMAREAELPTKGLGSAIHFRHSDVTDWYLPPAREEGKPLAAAIISEGRQNPEGRRSALVFQRLRNSIRRIQDDRGSVGPVSKI